MTFSTVFAPIATNDAPNDTTTFVLQVRNRLATFKNWPFSEEEGSDCTPARFNQL